ncbi:MAG TPA: NrfD/PsrC family molybdoenzyme membrane anchor subunit [Dehalococcoidia bacterium]|nr:NrfD/PsrC family molybdoenzyme membrane anchor subunit [Dehalococcoidia bacterium]
MRVEFSQRTLAIPVGLVWLAALAVGFVGVAQRLLTGHEMAGYTSSIPWGLWVAAYVYFVGLSAGAFLLSALIYVFGLRRLEPIGKLALFTALVSLIAALLTIWLDLGHMERFYNVFTRGNPVSMMAWMVWLYSAYFVVLTAELWFAIRGDLVEWTADPGPKGRFASLLLGRLGDAFGQRPRVAVAAAYDRAGDMRVVRTLGAIGVPLAIAFHGGVGALFGVVGARGFWNAPLYPLLFIVGALVSGGGLLTFITAFFWPNRGTKEHKDMVTYLGQITLALLAVYLIMVWAEYSITWYADIPAASRPLYQVLGGPYPWVFWVFQVALGAAVPIAMMTLRPRSVPWVGIASFLIAATFLATRLNIVIPGLIEPQLKGLDTAYTDGRLNYHYFPSLMEWLVFIFIGAFASGLFYAGFRALPLVGGRKEVT